MLQRGARKLCWFVVSGAKDEAIDGPSSDEIEHKKCWRDDKYDLSSNLSAMKQKSGIGCNRKALLAWWRISTRYGA